MNRAGKKKYLTAHQRAVLVDQVGQLKEKECVARFKQLHTEGYDARELLACCIEGVREVGERFERGEYFIAGLIMAGEIMRQVSEFLSPHLSGEQLPKTRGRCLIGTIEGDIHDLGKNIIKDQLQCNGFEVIDLGVDVPPQTFAEKALEVQPDIVGISCLLTHSVEQLRQAVSLLKKQRTDDAFVIVVGGACLDEVVGDFVQADCWLTDPLQAVEFCRQWIEARSK